MSEVFAPDAGGVRLALTPWQSELLNFLQTLLDEPSPDLPSDPYRDDQEANAEFGRLMESEVKEARIADRSAFEITLERATDADGVVLSLGEAEAWLRVLGEARLTLAARLGIKDASWEQDPRLASDPAHELLDYLSWLQAGLVEVLLEQFTA